GLSLRALHGGAPERVREAALSKLAGRAGILSRAGESARGQFVGASFEPRSGGGQPDRAAVGSAAFDEVRAADARGNSGCLRRGSYRAADDSSAEAVGRLAGVGDRAGSGAPRAG